jgi:hypothetical protein
MVIYPRQSCDRLTRRALSVEFSAEKFYICSAGIGDSNVMAV